MTKKEALQAWRDLKPGQPILKHMTPLHYKAKGSTYGACGIRIDGNPAFVDAVLSRLQDIIDGENHLTRLGLARNPVDGSKLGKSFDNQEQDAEVCYIRLHTRGNEGAIASSIFDKDLDGATERFIKA